MGSYLGVDWGGSCWVVVKSGDRPAITTEPSFLNVWYNHGAGADAILVDIPIGLPQSDTRACDDEAKTYLQNRGGTVFPVPSRAVVETDTYNKAREMNGESLGSQSWWHFPRIREVDVFLQDYPEAVKKIYESHPEVCFSKLAGESLVSKTTDEGLENRLELLENQASLHDRVRECYEKRRDGTDWHERISKGRLDDVLDAAVLAYTAASLELGPRSTVRSYPAFPTDEPEQDPRLGIPLEILHPGPE